MRQILSQWEAPSNRRSQEVLAWFTDLRRAVGLNPMMSLIDGPEKLSSLNPLPCRWHQSEPQCGLRDRLSSGVTKNRSLAQSHEGSARLRARKHFGFLHGRPVPHCKLKTAYFCATAAPSWLSGCTCQGTFSAEISGCWRRNSSDSEFEAGSSLRSENKAACSAALSFWPRRR